MRHRSHHHGCLNFHHPSPGEVVATDGRRTVAHLHHVPAGWVVDFADGWHLTAPTLGEARASVLAHDLGDGE
jgi:hypothetical protein